MFYSKNPVFSEKSIVKAEVLQENVLYPMRMFEHLYADYTDGIVTGVRLQAKDTDELLLSPGIIKYQGRLYHMEESACVEFEHNNRMNYLKIRFDNGECTSDGELFHTQVLLTNEETCFPYEMELGRFFTEAGAQLIDHAHHFEDFFIEHNHIDVRHVPYSARTEATISPEITVAFKRRLIVLPFDVIIPDEEQDKELTQKLLKELSGILNWVIQAMQGLMERKAFTKSEVCQKALDQYFMQSDSVRMFYLEICEKQEYSTRGDELFQLAMNILEDKPFERENHLKAAIVTRENANVMLMQAEELARQTHNIETIHGRVDDYMQRLANQRILTGMAIGIIVLLVVVIVLFYLYHLRKIALQRERVVNTLWNLKPEDVAAVPEAQVASETAEDTENSDEENEDEPVPVSHFITRFKEVIEARLEDSDVSVEDLAADMNLSRVQLYRKVKSLSGRSPVELLRTARLNRAYQLLLSSDKSVSEVAYAVGFSAPSYFTKCFRDEFGVSPSEVSNETA